MSDDETVDRLKTTRLPVVAEEAAPQISGWTAGSGEPPAEPVDHAALRDRITGTLKDIYDPEIPVNIYDLGLIYGFEVDDGGQVEISMTLTAPACPVAGALVQEVAEKVGACEGVSQARVELVWDPPWSMDRMSDEAKLELGLL